MNMALMKSLQVFLWWNIWNYRLIQMWNKIQMAAIIPEKHLLSFFNTNDVADF